MNDIIENEEEKAELKEKNKADYEKIFNDVSETMNNMLEEYMLSDFSVFYAKLLVYVGKERASQILEKMPEPVKKLVSEEYSKMQDKKNTDPDVISDVCSVFKRNGFYGDTMLKPFTKIENNEIGDCLNNSFFEKNPVLEMNVEHNWFFFEDIVMLDDRAIQKILREVDYNDLLKAVKGSNERVQEKILRNFSKRAEQMFREDLEFMGPVRLSDIQQSQTNVVIIIKKLIRNGEIVVSFDNDITIH